MSNAIIRIQRGRRRFRWLVDAGEDQLRIMDSNSRGVLEANPLFRVLRAEGDTVSMAKFFNRTLTETEYGSLVNKHRTAYLKELAISEGIFKERPTEPQAPAHARDAAPKALTRAEKDRKAFANLLEALGSAWTGQEIHAALEVAKELRLPKSRITTLARAGLKKEGAEMFLRVHSDMGPAGHGAAGSHREMSFKALARIFELVGYDRAMLSDFIEFCGERVSLLASIHDKDQLGNRGRITDMASVMETLFRLFDAMHGYSHRIEDIYMLKELGPDGFDASREEDRADIRDARFRVEAEFARQDLGEFDILSCLFEERLAPDAGNFLEHMRRRRGGF